MCSAIKTQKYCWKNKHCLHLRCYLAFAEALDVKRKSPAGEGHPRALLVLCSPGQHCHHKLLSLQSQCSTATGAAMWSAPGCRTTQMLQAAMELLCFSNQQFVSLSKMENHIQSEFLNSSVKCKQP